MTYSQPSATFSSSLDTITTTTTTATSDGAFPSPSPTTTATTIDTRFGNGSDSTTSIFDLHVVDMPLHAWPPPFNKQEQESLPSSVQKSESQEDDEDGGKLGLGFIPWALPPPLPPLSPLPPPPPATGGGRRDDDDDAVVHSEQQSLKTITIDGHPTTIDDGIAIKTESSQTKKNPSPSTTTTTTTTTTTPSPHGDQSKQQIRDRDRGPTSTRITGDTTKENDRSDTNNDGNSDATALLLKRKKAAHNAIEKRYRTNMNAKFMALGNAIPRPGHANSYNNNNNHPDSSLTTRRSALHHHQREQNKSEILTNALAYIHDLEDQNRRLQGELALLRESLWVTTMTMTTTATGMGMGTEMGFWR